MEAAAAALGVSNASPTPAPVLIPFVCPICAGANAVHLISLARAGGMDCAVCSKRLRSADIMKAMHAPRAASPTTTSAPRQHESPSRSAPAPRRADMVWPPTAESRAAVAPLRQRR